MHSPGPDPRVALGSVLAPGAANPVLEALDRLRPIVRIEANVTEPVALAAASLYSLLIRVHAHTIIEGDAVLGPNPWGAIRLSELPMRLASSRPSPAANSTNDMVIGVGPGAHGAYLWIGGDDWTARVGRSPQPAGGQFGLGLQASAIFAAAEALKMALGPQLAHVSIGDELVWNLWDYQNRPAPEILSAKRLLDQVVFFGSGSVGSSAIGLLVTQAKLANSVVIVDPDTFDSQRNPFRYPASMGSETGTKAKWTAGLLQSVGWDAIGYPVEVATWVRAQESPGVSGIVVASVDTVTGRLQVADALASVILSVGVSGMALHIQREHCFDEWACPYCEFVSAATPLSQAQVYNQMTGIPVDRLLQLCLGENLLTEEDLTKAVGIGKLHLDRVPELIGRRLDDLIQRVYAQAMVSGIGNTDLNAVIAVSTPFVSWMGGLLIVAELTKATMGATLVDRRVDLEMSGLPLGAVSRRSHDQSGNCICNSPYRRRWATRLHRSE